MRSIQLMLGTIAGALVLALGPVNAQTVIGEQFGRTLGDNLGTAVASAPDMNGDGTRDILVGAPGLDEVHLLSGASLSLLRVYRGCTGCSFGESVDSVADVDGDEIPELLVGAPNADPVGTNSGRAFLLSGASGRVLRTLDGAAEYDFFGRWVCGADDLDGDGAPDLVVGAPGSDLGGDGSGSVTAWSATDGRQVLLAFGKAGEQFGHAFDVLDREGSDGAQDLLVGAPGGNYVQVIAGDTGEVRLHVDGPFPFLSFGEAVSAVGDLDRDGVADFIASAPASFLPQSPGIVQVISGVDGSELFSVQDVDNFGNAVSGIGDADGDGIGDVLVGAQISTTLGFGQGEARLYSGANGELIWLSRGQCSTGLFGHALTGVGDLNGDGYADALVGDPQALHSGTGKGWLRVLSGHDGTWVDLGLGHAFFPCPPLLQASGDLTAGSELRIDLAFAPANKAAWLVVGTSTAPTPLYAGLLVPSVDKLVSGLVTTAAGTLSVAGRWPTGIPPGMTFYFQAWVQVFPATEGAEPVPVYYSSNTVRGTTP